MPELMSGCIHMLRCLNHRCPCPVGTRVHFTMASTACKLQASKSDFRKIIGAHLSFNSMQLCLYLLAFRLNGSRLEGRLRPSWRFKFMSCILRCVCVLSGMRSGLWPGHVTGRLDKAWAASWGCLVTWDQMLLHVC